MPSFAHSSAGCFPPPSSDRRGFVQSKGLAYTGCPNWTIGTKWGIVAGLVQKNSVNVKDCDVVVIDHKTLKILCATQTDVNGEFATDSTIPINSDGVIVVAIPKAGVDANAEVFHRVMPV